ncbi:MAG TPA: hypothetical protein VEW03_08100 [Longimicrobiaceae bacterium]|nr:hypothetical protein [Longimicrobiaceae bacterium]
MATVRDPVCGMEVDSATALRLEHGEHNHFFCSEACRDRFQASSASYGDRHTHDGDPGLERHEPPHTTTGIMTAPKFGSAGSGGLEYEPGPERHGDKH